MEYVQSKISQQTWDKLVKDATHSLSADKKYISLNESPKSKTKKTRPKAKSVKTKSIKTTNIKKIPKNNIF